MKTKIPLILLVACLFCLTGCKSEVDKCVEAKAVQICESDIPASDPPVKFWKYWEKDANAQKCYARLEIANGGDWRVECINPQAIRK